MRHYNVCYKMMEKGRNIPHPTCFFPSPSFYNIHCSDAWNAFQTHTFRCRRPRREEACGMPNVSSLLHHFITYIVLNRDTCVFHCVLYSRRPLTHLYMEKYSLWKPAILTESSWSRYFLWRNPTQKGWYFRLTSVGSCSGVYVVAWFLQII